jgi:hypothetical protein
LAALQCWLPTLLLMLTHPKLVSLDTTILLERKSLCLLVLVAGSLLNFHAVVLGIACMLEIGITCHEDRLNGTVRFVSKAQPHQHLISLCAAAPKKLQHS